MTKSRQDYYPVNGSRSHGNCKNQTGVFRPGKTARDKARGVNRTVPNRRIWDDRAKAFVKV
jgi:hypothetical protein